MALPLALGCLPLRPASAFPTPPRLVVCPVQVSLPATSPSLAGGRRFAVVAIRPNPVYASRSAVATVELPDAAPAVLELIDTAGRRTPVRQLVTGPGRVQVTLEGLHEVRPGRYVLRLRRADRSRSRTLIVLP